MSIRPVQFNGMIQNQGELSVQKAQDDAKMNIHQAQATVSVDQAQEQKSSSVNALEENENEEYRFNDKEGDGKGYQKNKKKKDGKVIKEETEDGKVFVKNKVSSFDVTV